MINILFYKYTEMNYLENWRKEHQQLCEKLGLKGKVLIAKEGINGCVSGDYTAIEYYKNSLKAEFKDIEFKERSVEKHTFRKTIVRIRKEIVTFKQNVKLTKDNYIKPEQLKEMYDKNEEFYIMDVRNNYESAIGKFKNAITPNIEVFSEFPNVLQHYAHLKDKQIVVYCTGGVRCEKASALMQEKGFNVKQLHGGILKYGEVTSEHWEGKCFVFDERVVVDIGKSKTITKCVFCDLDAARYYNCSNVKCDKRFIRCDKCNESVCGDCG